MTTTKRKQTYLPTHQLMVSLSFIIIILQEKKIKALQRKQVNVYKRQYVSLKWKRIAFTS